MTCVECLLEAFDRRVLCDVAFDCRDGQVYGHTSWLRLRCPKLLETRKHLQDVPFNVANAVIRSLYCDQVCLAEPTGEEKGKPANVNCKPTEWTQTVELLGGLLDEPLRSCMLTQGLVKIGRLLTFDNVLDLYAAAFRMGPVGEGCRRMCLDFMFESLPSLSTEHRRGCRVLRQEIAKKVDCLASAPDVMAELLRQAAMPLPPLPKQDVNKESAPSSTTAPTTAPTSVVACLERLHKMVRALPSGSSSSTSTADTSTAGPTSEALKSTAVHSKKRKRPDCDANSAANESSSTAKRLHTEQTKETSTEQVHTVGACEVGDVGDVGDVGNVKLVVEDGSVFYVHGFILAMRSAFFSSILNGQYQDSMDKTIEVRKVPWASASAMKVLIEWMYTDRLDADVNLAWQIVGAADFYQFHQTTVTVTAQTTPTATATAIATGTAIEPTTTPGRDLWTEVTVPWRTPWRETIGNIVLRSVSQANVLSALKMCYETEFTEMAAVLLDRFHWHPFSEPPRNDRQRQEAGLGWVSPTEYDLPTVLSASYVKTMLPTCSQQMLADIIMLMLNCNATRTPKPGMHVDVFDPLPATRPEWRAGIITHVYPESNSVRVHYMGWADHWDVTLKYPDPTRLAPPFTRVRKTNIAHSPPHDQNSPETPSSQSTPETD